MALEPDHIQTLTFKTPTMTQDHGRKIHGARSTLTPVEVDPGESRFLHACTVELDGGVLLMFNDEDELSVGINYLMPATSLAEERRALKPGSNAVIGKSCANPAHLPYDPGAWGGNQ
jgi:hypothetical protein